MDLFLIFLIILIIFLILFFLFIYTAQKDINLRSSLKEYKAKTYNIKGARIKLSATGGGKNVKLYGYFTRDNSYISSSAHIKGNLSAFDTFKTSGKFPGSNADGTYTYNGVKYTITDSEIMYLIVTG